MMMAARPPQPSPPPSADSLEPQLLLLRLLAATARRRPAAAQTMQSPTSPARVTERPSAAGLVVVSRPTAVAAAVASPTAAVLFPAECVRTVSPQNGFQGSSQGVLSGARGGQGHETEPKTPGVLLWNDISDCYALSAVRRLVQVFAVTGHRKLVWCSVLAWDKAGLGKKHRQASEIFGRTSTRHSPVVSPSSCVPDPLFPRHAFASHPTKNHTSRTQHLKQTHCSRR